MDKERIIRLTETVRGAGWASKLGPGDLDKALCGLPLISDPNLVVGLERTSDAGVYKLTEELAIIQTIDYFTPIVDDPFIFGQIAVANALSDIYAMGGKPITAMNVVCFPSETMEISILRDILKGGLDKMREAGVVLVGGHSVYDRELKYGLSVTGIIHPQKIITKHGAKPGDKLILTKPLGTGIINTALKGGIADAEIIAKVIAYMVALNKSASELMRVIGVNACTDITGFGLLGHLAEMVEDNPIGVEVYANSVPFFSEAIEFAQMGLIPGGTFRNKEFRLGMVELATPVPDYLLDVLFDPQTSGGLLISLPTDKAEILLGELLQNMIKEAAIIGEVTREPQGKIIIK